MTGKMAVVAGAALVLLGVFVGAAADGQGTPVFVVYGTMYTDETRLTPVSGGYTIIVRNRTRGLSTQTSVGTGMNAGKFCAVFVDYAENNVAGVGDVMQVRGKRISDGAVYVYEERAIVQSELQSMRARMDIFETRIATRSCSWGAIKSLFR